jgi:DNA-binding transcriptional LysR family regulator
MAYFPRITLRKLEVFLTVAECGGFRAAAERLGMTQPSVSSHMQALEDQVGGSLFRRQRGRGVELTELGQIFIAHAKLLLADADTMASDVNRLRLEAERRVVFACQRSLGEFLPPLLADFADKHRDLELITRVGRQEEVLDWIRSGTANVGLFLGNHDYPGLTSVVVGQQEFVVIASPRHPLAARADIAPSELEKCSFVGAPEDSLLGQAIGSLLSQVGVRSIHHVSKATEFEFLRALVIKQVGIYCCLRRRIQADLDRGTLVALRLGAPPLMMDVRQVYSTKLPVFPAVATFGEFLRQQYRLAGTESSGIATRHR